MESNLGMVMIKQLVAAAEANQPEDTDLVLRTASHIAGGKGSPPIITSTWRPGGGSVGCP